MTIYFGDGTDQATAASAAEVIQIQSGFYSGQTYGAIGNGGTLELSAILYATITPTSSSNKVLIDAMIQCDAGRNGEYVMAVLKRGPTSDWGSAVQVGTGNSAGNRRRITAFSPATDQYWQPTPIHIHWLDSPATTAAIKYTIELSHSSTSTTNIYLNSQSSDANSSTTGRGVSCITVMEVAV